MPISVVQTKTNPTSANTEFASTANPSLTLDAAPTAGNTLVAFLYSTSASATITPPSGWTASPSTPYAGSHGLGKVGVWAKVAGVGESATVTFTLSAAATGVLVVLEVSGLAPTVQWDAVGQAAERSATGTSLSVSTSGATSVADSFAVAGLLTGGSDGGSLGWGSTGFTTDFNASEGGVGHKILSATGVVTATPTWTSNLYASALLGVLKSAPAAGGNIKVWNGSAWVAKPVKVWNGSAWVAKPMKRWNGSAWVVTSY